MIERLYCPDFSAVFGPEFRNPYEYPMVDSLIWPTLLDLDLPKEGKKLIEITEDGHHPLFYRRKITVNNLATELKASGLAGGCLQAIDLGREYGIPTEVVVQFARKNPQMLFPIASPLASAEGIEKFKKQAKEVVAAVIYPSYQQLDLQNTPEGLYKIVEICQKEAIPLKIDLGNMYLPENDPTLCTPEKVRKFMGRFPKAKFILSGIDILGNGAEFINILRYQSNCAVELDPRTFGGITPEHFFAKIFEIPGAIQNCWGRIILGSSTPMLESSQVTRGWWAATEKRPFAQQCLLRTWGFRNIHRIAKLPIMPTKDVGGVAEAPEAQLLPPTVIQKSENELFIQQDLALNSFSITQLLFITPYVLEAAKSLTKKYTDYPYGEFVLKSYHTTTSLIINEHEVGNYLQLHYDFAQDTMADASDKLHTVAAEENRADFNYPDHLLATSRGDKIYTVPILDGKIQLGGRENLYVLVTFGPRAIKLNFSVKLFKGQKL